VTRRQITVKVMRGGREIKDIERPLHIVNGRKAVVFQKRLWEVQRGNRIQIDGAPLEDRGEQGGDARAPKITGGHTSRSSDVSKANHGIRATKTVSGVQDSDAQAVYPVDVEAGEPVAVAPEKWDPQQIAVIEAPRNARQLVDAGPGTGKTAVACRRVAWLIDACDVTPSNVWLVSFTRTAVKEIRNRIRHYLRDPADVWSVKVATIDSHAWAIHSGFDAHASLAGSYEENIQQVTELIQKNDGVFEYLAEAEHLVVDEAQDIVGPRASLVLELIRKLDKACGVTVFADEAQAIYGFADDDGGSTRAEGHLPERLRAHRELGFQPTALSAIYRTDRKHLRKLFTEVRAKVLAKRPNDDPDCLERVTEMVRRLADGEPAVIEALDERNHGALHSTFILFRRRVDALTAASFWGMLPHRLRMSGLPTLAEPWLGALLWDRTEKKLRQAEFEKLWAERVEGRCLTALTAQSGWELLVKLAGESRTLVSTQTARARLGRAAPPSDFTRSDFGLGGPVFGTIHGCKGREADSVLLMLPASIRPDADDDEEARVVFVGATRAKVELRVGKGFKFIKSRTVEGSNRACALQTKTGKPRAQVEFGHDGDLDVEGVAGRALFRTADEVGAAHQWLLTHADRVGPVKARALADHDWRYRVEPAEGPPLAFLAERVNSDLFKIGKQVKTALGWNRRLRPAFGPDHLKTFGASTFVLHPDDPQKDLLHEPWATSGFVLAPVVQGFDMIYFKTY